ncbi:hypothetical protein H7B90_19835 [Cohnella xylanilytica]|uniref:Uncharacterized protein n=1 Tax=Cohnella xylanilytica TaxID=557555 RepID=A0A841U1J2_9BACL|nr:hypothetical protein [Cohnella xylanilytica]MBB6693649.1 hypothetical protein [Cohnella xylanilytica]
MRNRAFVVLIIVAFLLFIGFLAYYFNQPDPVFGNDEESIATVINSIKGYEDKSIEILEIEDLDDQRMVGFLSDHNPGFIQFQKNKNGNYLWKHIEVRNNESFSIFIIPGFQRFMIVTNNENKVAKMQVNINGQQLEQPFTPYQSNVAWVRLPETDRSDYEFRDYKYYDQDGNLLNDS